MFLFPGNNHYSVPNVPIILMRKCINLKLEWKASSHARNACNEASVYILILNYRSGWVLWVFNPLTRIIREGPKSDQPWTLGPSAGHRVGRTRAIWSGLLPAGQPLIQSRENTRWTSAPKENLVDHECFPFHSSLLLKQPLSVVIYTCTTTVVFNFYLSFYTFFGSTQKLCAVLFETY